ncbi:MAG: HEAT repeat domain-containing protein [Thermoguttaceae bacterium]
MGAMPLLLGLGLLGSVVGFVQAQDDDSDPLVQMILELVNDSDRDMRALGLQQVREEVPGEAATKKFAELLPTLTASGQAGLLEALGDRQDQAARPAIMDRLENSEEESVRAAAIRAIGALGNEGDVALLAAKVGTEAALEKTAARESLVRLRGELINGAVLTELEKGEPAVRVELLGVLAARNAKDTVETVLESAADSDAAVRLAALEALRYLADVGNVPGVIDALKAAGDEVEVRKAELALLAVCSREGQACADALIAGIDGAKPAARITLLRAITRAGGSNALDTIVAALEDEDESVADEAVRMLAAWPDAAAGPHLVEIAKTSESLRRQVLALRGMVRLGSPLEDKPADLELLTQTMNLAKRSQEKRLVVGVLGGIGSPEALALAVAAVDDSTLQEDAGRAVVAIAEKIEDGDKAAIRSAIGSVLDKVKSQPVRERAQKVLGAL